MSGGVRYTSFYPSDWRSGCIGLSFEEQGFYIAVCAHCWETGARLPLDDAEAASRLQTDVRKYRRLKTVLIAKGKLHAAENGVYNGRAEHELGVSRRAIDKAKDKVLAADVVTPRDDDPERTNGGDPQQRREPAGAELLNTVQNTSDRSLGEVAAKSPRSLSEVCQNSQQNQRPLIEPYPDPEPKELERKAVLSTEQVAEMAKMVMAEAGKNLGAERLGSVPSEDKLRVCKSLNIADAEPLVEVFDRWRRREGIAPRSDLGQWFFETAPTLWKNNRKVHAACRPIPPEPPPKIARASSALTNSLIARSRNHA